MHTASRQDLSAAAPGLSNWVKILYGVGEIANAIKLVTFAIYSLFFATSVKGGLPGTWIGVVAFAAMLWDASIDPFIGHFTDGARAGPKRFAFMLAGALTMGAGYWAFFSPPRNLSTEMLFAWLLAASFVVRTATSIYSIPYYAVGMAMSRDYHERTSITGIRGIASAIGTLLTASLSFVLFFPEKVPGVDPKLNHSGYESMGLTFGLVMTVVALVALSATLPQRHIQHPQSESSGSMWAALRNPSFRLLSLSLSLVVMALTFNSSLLLHYLKYYVRVNGSVALSSAQAIFYSSGLLGTLFWLRISRKLDKTRLYMLSVTMTAVLLLAALALFGEGRPLGTGNARPLLVGYGLAGFFNCILWFIPQSMLADIADENEWTTGKRQEGALFGMFSFVQQLSAGLGVMLAGGLLEHFVRLVPGEVRQSAFTIVRIGIVSSVVPGALLLVAAVVMLGYPLTRSRVESIQVELRRGD